MGCMPTDTHLNSLLHALGKRAHEPKPNLAPAVGVIGDIARLLQCGSIDDLRHTHAAVAALREQLEYGEEVVKRPSKALVGENSHTFLAGAMWAISEAMTARIEHASDLEATMNTSTRRAALRQLIITALLRDGALSASRCVTSPEGKALNARPDELSRILSDLLGQGLVQAVPTPADADRRTRFFALTPQGRMTFEKAADVAG